jgi:uncharacterized protein YrrD
MMFDQQTELNSVHDVMLNYYAMIIFGLLVISNQIFLRRL